MSRQSAAWPLPIPETVQHPTEVIDWRRLDGRAGDLNYRPKVRPRPLSLLELIGLAAAAVAVAGLMLAAVCWASDLLFSVWVTPWLVAISGGLLLRSMSLTESGLATLVSVLTPPAVWAALALFATAGPGVGALGVTILLALPAVVWLADRIASDRLSWHSANPRVDHATMLKWREAWTRRFTFGGPTPARGPLGNDTTEDHRRLNEALRGYAEGPLWLLGAVALATIVAAVFGLLGSRPEQAAWLTTLLMLGLLAAAIFRSWRHPAAWDRVLFAMAAFRQQDPNPNPTPSCWQSPAGFSSDRRAVFFTALVAIAAATLGLSCGWLALAVWSTPPPGTTPGWAAWMNLPPGPGMLFGSMAEHPVGWGIRLFVVAVASVVTPAALLFLSLVTLIGPVLAGLHQALESPSAYDAHSDWMEVDGYAERLRNSRNPKERRAVLSGEDVHCQQPVLVDRKLYREHKHIIGPTGTGKTTLGVMTDAEQLVRSGDGAVVIFDGKGDLACFNRVRQAAENAGRPFKHFTNLPFRSTYLFDTFDQRVLQRLTMQQVLGKIIASLNLHHGSDYARGFFSAAQRKRLKDSIQLTLPDRNGKSRFAPIENFADLKEVLTFLATSSDGRDDAEHLAFLVESLAECEQLNLSPDRVPSDPVWRNAIRMRDVLRENQVVYFYMVGATDIATVGEIGRLALYELLTAAIAYKQETNKTLGSYFIADEAQTIIGQNIETVLSQCRSYGVSCVLAHQALSQLAPPGGADLREIVMNSTCIKQYFAARDPWLQDYISKMSGRSRYFSSSYEVSARDAAGGNVGMHAVAPDREGGYRVNISEYIGPRLNSQDLRNIGRDPNQSVVCVERGEGLTQYLDYFPMHTDWPTSESRYEELSEQAWPAPTDETIVVQSEWPDAPSVIESPGVGKPTGAQQLEDLIKRLDQSEDSTG